MSDPFEEIMREQSNLGNLIQRTRLKEIPIYQKGSFVPTLVGSTTPGTFTYSAQFCDWTRIGNLMFFTGRLALTAITVAPVGNMSINGFPFAGVSTAGNLAGGATVYLWQTNLATAHTQVEGQYNTGLSQLFLIKSADNLAPGVVQGGDIALVGGGVEFRFVGHAQIA